MDELMGSLGSARLRAILRVASRRGVARPGLWRVLSHSFMSTNLSKVLEYT